MNIEMAKEILGRSNGNGMHDIWVPSVGRPVQFKHMTTGQRKSVSKMSMEYDSDAVKYHFVKLALVGELCLDKTIVIEDLTDADFVTILASLRRNNVLTPLQLKTRCSKCDKDFKFDVDFDDMDRRARAYSPKSAVLAKRVGATDFEVTLSDPSVVSFIGFSQVVLESMKHRENSESYARFQLLNYPVQFVGGFKIGGEPVDGFSRMDFFGKVAFFDGHVPSELLFDEDGIIDRVYEMFPIDRLDCLFQEVKCPGCGDAKEGLVTIDSFFTI